MDSWALISVSDKRGLVDLARWLVDQGLQLLATQSTATALSESGFTVHTVESLTGFGEILDGRVKTLHPKVYAGLLADESLAHHRAQREALEAPRIDVVVVNLYPYETALEQNAPLADRIESIDIGGVALIRAAAKNFARVIPVVDPEQYAEFMQKPLHEWTLNERRLWAQAALYHTAWYDAMIASTLGPLPEGWWPRRWAIGGTRQESLRYGENPHQPAAFYRWPGPGGVAHGTLLQGKALSYNNWADLDTAWRLAASLEEEPAAVVVKHQTPCAVAVADTVNEAYRKAHDADPVSIFGGIVAVNRPVDTSLAEALTDLFLEVVVAPDFTPEALATLGRKKNLRVFQVPAGAHPMDWEVRSVTGGLLVQARDDHYSAWDRWTRVAGPDWAGRVSPADLRLAWASVAMVKSNAIVVVNHGVTVGIGGGQTNRVDAARQALERAGANAQGAVLASDGFFPFGDVLELCQAYGIAVVIEPGGSVRDQESVEKAEQYGITLLFTGERHFRH
ncbi:bifunctional phosphoribosylaminoimidazolecarboxamide formyltransferase/IMP cyclohydrolase [Sulfobacillus acidophilus TPY]|uniref:Bifunctional purine biosynthesis protein PurH n=1 Tax=Sulfobacillus acidophilus (strain ATCC 700253 / DSM 10332 / NAL) TaxID=679936 RepID=G8TXC8_SULAD|nr:bifunctional phosphoribosylaminoimidazolecarboxamide formyltransferase/IMP cyclohydrolase [Sulfobacillus acidophilus TPY]AEW06130.1 IMP cyclohydrolase, phosphoribosylaminoimidazolecarboxamide formyltransferase [Sulfobacillus acidophilus DSM 10332]